MNVGDKLKIASNTLLAPSGLTEQGLGKILDTLLGPSIDYADLYFQNTRQESWVLEDSLVKGSSYHIQRGVGARAVSGQKSGFAYSEDLLLPALEEAARAARSISLKGGPGVWQVPAAVPQQSARLGRESLYAAADPLQLMSDIDKIQLLRSLDAAARQMDPRVTQVIINLSGAYETVLMLCSDTGLHADIRPLVRLDVRVMVEQKGQREQGRAGGGGRLDYAMFLKDQCALGYVRAAVDQALIKLHAKPAPAGMMPVVLGPGWPGVLLHEAIGHGLEGDFNRKGSSTFSGRIGEMVASKLCTIVDDGTLVGRRGSLNMDDEGTPTQCTTLIEQGVLKGYIQDKLNARLMGLPCTGNGRRESYAHLVIPRMTNTYMLPGPHRPEEIIASVDRGIYAVQFEGGQVDITSGQFVFEASEAYMIEKGKITYPVKGATLIGNGPEILKQVTMLGNDLQLDTGVGVCGKEGQSVPVGVGQPTLKIAEMTVGGTQC